MTPSVTTTSVDDDDEFSSGLHVSGAGGAAGVDSPNIFPDGGRTTPPLPTSPQPLGTPTTPPIGKGVGHLGLSSVVAKLTPISETPNAQENENKGEPPSQILIKVGVLVVSQPDKVKICCTFFFEKKNTSHGDDDVTRIQV